MKKNYLWSLCAMMSLCVCANAQDDLYADSIRHYELAEINVTANQVSSTTPMVYSTLKENQIKEFEAENAEPAKGKETIVFDDFEKIELKVGTVINSEKVEKSDKKIMNAKQNEYF